MITMRGITLVQWCSAILVVFLVAVRTALADAYPSRTVTIIVPTTAGDPTDLMARGVARNLSKRWRQNVIVKNQPGAGTLLGARTVANSAPDGYTLLMMFSGTLLNGDLHREIKIDFEKDLTPVARIADSYFVVVVNPLLPIKSLADLIAYAKQKSDGLSYATVSPGSLQALAIELLCQMAGIKMVPVPYDGSTPALTGVIQNQVQVMFAPVGSAKPYIVSGALRAVAVGSLKRVPFLPDVPTIAESGLPGYDVASWQLMAVPSGTPKSIVNKLNKDVQEAASNADVRTMMSALGAAPSSVNTVEEDEALFKTEIKKWDPFLSEIRPGN